MSSLSKITIAFGLVLVSPLVISGIKDVAPPADATKPTKVESMARVKQAPDEGNSITCWQEGRQIFRAAKLDAKSVAKSNKDSFVVAANGKSIKLLDFKNGLCILETPSEESKK